MREHICILYVDDYPLDRELVRDALENEAGGFKVIEAASRADFETALAQGGFDLVLSDFNILGFEGLQVLEAVRAKSPHLPVIIVTGTGSEEVAAEAIKRGAADYVLKTQKHIQHLPITIRTVLEKKRLEEERQQAEDALRTSEARYQLIADHVGDIVWQLDMGLHFIYLSPAVERVLGYTVEETLGAHVTKFLDEEGMTRMKAVIQSRLKNLTRTDKPSEYKMKHKDGYWVDVEVVSSPVFDKDGHANGFTGITRNITERKQAEEKIRQINAELEQRVEERTRELRQTQEQFIQQERLAIPGRLAGGMGHELRNPLSVISNAIYLLRLILLNPDEKVDGYLRIIEDEIRTAETIIADLLDYSSQKFADREPINVSELVQRVLGRYPVHPSIQVTLKIPANLPPIFADSRQLEQILGVLVVNACQAMPGGGELQISSHPLSVASDQAAQADPLKTDSWLLITIRDTGIGIPPENLTKLFQPLFTTKPKGIGLGLAVSQKLAEANGGRIEVQSETGKGSTFMVYLPIHSVIASDSEAVSSKREIATPGKAPSSQ